MPEIEKAITATTRNPRAGEVNSVDYYFYSKEEFNEKKKAWQIDLFTNVERIEKL